MKESEAKTKWCPMVRVLVTPNDALWQGRMLSNRGDLPASNEHCLCIGSACMMWENHCIEGHDQIGDCGLKSRNLG